MHVEPSENGSGAYMPRLENGDGLQQTVKTCFESSIASPGKPAGNTNYSNFAHSPSTAAASMGYIVFSMPAFHPRPHHENCR
jgi:hypothetical protein